MIAEGYGDARTLERRARNMEAWLAEPQLLEADQDAEYAAVIEIDLAEIDQPIVCAPTIPTTHVAVDVQGDRVDEVFIEL